MILKKSCPKNITPSRREGVILDAEMDTMEKLWIL